MKLLKEKIQRGKNKTGNNFRHGMRKTFFYTVWHSMKGRCKNIKNSAYNYYGGRGIKLCKKWNKFDNFRDDMYESYIKHCQIFGRKNTSIDRINNNGNYSKENCRWATKLEQNNNRRNTCLITFKDRTQTLMQWSEELKLNYKKTHLRLKRYRWSIKKAFTNKK